MLLRNPISNTKRFFQRTLQSVKSIFSTGSSNADYHKIPKASPPPFTAMDRTSDGFGGSFGKRRSKDGFERLYVDYNDRWEKKPAETRTSKNREETEFPGEGHARVKTSKSYQARLNPLPKMGHGGGVNNGEEKLSSREERSWLVARKLKGLEMMDMSNVDHVQDIEEVLHYYSLLRCPEYLDIVDKFLMDVYAEFFSTVRTVTSTPVSVNSRSRSSLLLRS